MAVDFDVENGDLKTIHYFKKKHYNLYKKENVTNTSYIRLDIGGSIYDYNYDGDFDGIHIMNIKADVTLKVQDGSSNYFRFFNGVVNCNGRYIYVTLPVSVTGDVFVKVSFDLYFYTETNGGIEE